MGAGVVRLKVVGMIVVALAVITTVTCVGGVVALAA